MLVVEVIFHQTLSWNHIDCSPGPDHDYQWESVYYEDVWHAAHTDVTPATLNTVSHSSHADPLSSVCLLSENVSWHMVSLLYSQPITISSTLSRCFTSRLISNVRSHNKQWFNDWSGWLLTWLILSSVSLISLMTKLSLRMMDTWDNCQLAATQWILVEIKIMHRECGLESGAHVWQVAELISSSRAQVVCRTLGTVVLRKIISPPVFRPVSWYKHVVMLVSGQ